MTTTFAPLALQDFLTAHRDELLARTRAAVAARGSPPTTSEEIAHGVPMLFNGVVEALRAPPPAPPAPDATTGRDLGGQALRRSLTVAQLVRDHGELRLAVTELAGELEEPITDAELGALDRCLDEAVARAFAQGSVFGETRADHGVEQLGELAHDMRGRLSASLVSLDLLRKGRLGIGGLTGAALGNGLSSLRSLVDCALARVRLESGEQDEERVGVSALLEEMAADAAIYADIRRVHLSVVGPARQVAVSVDRPLLAAALSKVIHNAITFSRAEGHALLAATVTRGRVAIEMHDECGGLAPEGDVSLFGAPGRRGGARGDAGLGLAIARECVEAIGGRVRVRDVPDVGCVLGFDLPRVDAA